MKSAGRWLAASMVTVLLFLSIGLASPRINVSVQEVGSGSGKVLPVVCSGGFYPFSGGIRTQFGNELSPGSVVYAVLYDANGNLVAINSTELPHGLPANTPVDVHFSQADMNSASLSKTRILVASEGTEDNSGSIALSVQKISVGNWSGEYAQPINITYPGSTELKNWPVRIVLSNSNPENRYGSGTYYIEWDVLQNNIDSIHFVDERGHLLYYWIEIFKAGTWYNGYDDAYAVIWVNVTDIPPDGTKIWMIYGKGDYSSYDNGHRVFPFFDDFENWNGWIKYKNGIVRQVQDSYPNSYGQRYAAEKTGYNDPNGAYKSLGRILRRDGPYEGLILEYWDNRVRDTGGNLDRVGLIDDSGNGYGAVLNTIGRYIQIDVRNHYTGHRYSTVGTSLSMNTWYFVRLMVLKDGAVNMSVYDGNGNLIKSTSHSDDSYSSFSRVYIFGGQTYHIDGLRVRYYVSNPPQAHVDEWYAYLSLRPSCGGNGVSSDRTVSSLGAARVLSVEGNRGAGGSALHRGSNSEDMLSSK